MARIVQEGCRFFVGLILAATAPGKGFDLSGFADAIATYKLLPEVLDWPVALGMTATEACLSAWLLSGRQLQQADVEALSTVPETP